VRITGLGEPLCPQIELGQAQCPMRCTPRVVADRQGVAVREVLVPTQLRANSTGR
jgi:hypothetical protein